MFQDSMRRRKDCQGKRAKDKDERRSPDASKVIVRTTNQHSVIRFVSGFHLEAQGAFLS